ncbi:MAG: patatin-like phospholipase family protein [Gammaproteobacteria bacterium]|nr:MAG: patatin-like phospholipase family protein [Gammaproteobacteria bacterium]
MLTIKAGRKALKLIKQHGLHPEMFYGMIGASGGPKWFTLYGLDDYLASEFWPKVSHPITTFGSSAGAWRMACHACQHPADALSRLAEYYAHETYSPNADRHEITTKARKMLSACLSPEDRLSILNNDKFRTHIVAVRSRGLTASERHWSQALGLLLTATVNTISRRALRLTCERAVFYTGTHSRFPNDGLPTLSVPLSDANFEQALMASGAIPLVLFGQKNIPGAPNGCYRDGGLIDYHFDVPFSQHEGLFLYPHFYDHIVPGWFDKALKWRKVHAAWLENVVLIAPSRDFVRALPYQKIPDRKDFTKLAARERFSYWEKVLSESKRLADALDHIIRKGPTPASLRPLTS